MCMNHNGRHLLRLGAFTFSLIVTNKVTNSTVSINYNWCPSHLAHTVCNVSLFHWCSRAKSFNTVSMNHNWRPIHLAPSPVFAIFRCFTGVQERNQYSVHEAQLTPITPSPLFAMFRCFTDVQEQNHYQYRVHESQLTVPQPLIFFFFSFSLFHWRSRAKSLLIPCPWITTDSPYLFLQFFAVSLTFNS